MKKTLFPFLQPRVKPSKGINETPDASRSAEDAFHSFFQLIDRVIAMLPENELLRASGARCIYSVFCRLGNMRIVLQKNPPCREMLPFFQKLVEKLWEIAPEIFKWYSEEACVQTIDYVESTLSNCTNTESVPERVELELECFLCRYELWRIDEQLQIQQNRFETYLLERNSLCAKYQIDINNLDLRHLNNAQKVDCIGVFDNLKRAHSSIDLLKNEKAARDLQLQKYTSLLNDYSINHNQLARIVLSSENK